MRSASEIWAGDGQARIRDALTELHTYALVLDAELQKTESRLVELDRSGEHTRELPELRRRRTELIEQLDLLDRTISELRSAMDPAGRYL
jgi:hypothetical protein